MGLEVDELAILLLRMSSSLTALSMIFLEVLSTTRHFHWGSRVKSAPGISGESGRDRSGGREPGSHTSPCVMFLISCTMAGTAVSMLHNGFPGEGWWLYHRAAPE